MIAITALAALIVRVYLFFELSWFAFTTLNTYLQARGSEPGMFAEVYPQPILLLFPVLIWLTLFIWAPSICRALAGRYKDASLDLGLKGADLVRLAALGGAIGMLIPAAGQLHFAFTSEFTLPWYLGTLIGAALGIILLIIALVPEPAASRLAGLIQTAATRARNGGEPS